MISVPDELEAVRHALSLAEPDDLLVVCADEITAVWKEVTAYPNLPKYGEHRPQPTLLPRFQAPQTADDLNKEVANARQNKKPMDLRDERAQQTETVPTDGVKRHPDDASPHEPG
jgi:hypothetical protein